MYNDDDINFDDYETSFYDDFENMPVEDLLDYRFTSKKDKNEKLRESRKKENAYLKVFDKKVTKDTSEDYYVNLYNGRKYSNGNKEEEREFERFEKKRVKKSSAERLELYRSTTLLLRKNKYNV